MMKQWRIGFLSVPLGSELWFALHADRPSMGQLRQLAAPILPFLGFSMLKRTRL